MYAEIIVIGIARKPPVISAFKDMLLLCQPSFQKALSDLSEEQES